MKKTLKELFDFFPEVNYITRNPLGYVNLFKNKPVYDTEYEVYFGTPNDGIYSHDFLEVDFGDRQICLNICTSREEVFNE